jgi:pyruvate/2-oxoglutarate dehydrogenase complex dihydrolipoamide dehydrogenase (E3) component
VKTVDIAIIGTTRAGLRARALWPNKTVALVCLPESPETLLARHTAAVSGLPFAVEPEAISLRGPCVFIDRTTFQVGEETIRAKKILLMSGCRHRVPAIDGLSTTPHFFSTTAPTDTPPSCLIVGAGHAGVAMAQRARQAGAQVSVVAGAERLLPKEDLSISDFFINRMRNQGITVHQNGDVVAVKPLGDAQIEATLQSGLKRTTVTTHRLVIAAGLVPNTAQLGLERAGIYVHDDGAMPTCAMPT